MRLLPKYNALLGKLIVKYGVMSDLLDFSESEKDILRLARTEYDFYHAHEIKEAGLDPASYINSVKEQVVAEDRKREVLTLKRKSTG